MDPNSWTGGGENKVESGLDREIHEWKKRLLELDPGDSEVVTVFTDGEIHRARIEADGLRQMPVSFDLVKPRGQVRVTGPRNVRRLTVTPEGLGGGEGKLELLGLQGALEVFVDVEHAVPVLIRGRVKIAGQVEIRLTRMATP